MVEITIDTGGVVTDTVNLYIDLFSRNGFTRCKNMERPEPIHGEITVAAKSIAEALASEAIPTLYANGARVIQTNSDTGVILYQIDKPVAVIYVSHTLAKAIAFDLNKSIGAMEEHLDAPIPTVDELKAAREAMLAPQRVDPDD